MGVGQKKRISEYVLLGYVSFLFFFLEIVLFAGLRFTTDYFHAQLIIAIGLGGLLAGGALASGKKSYDWHPVVIGASALSPLFGFLGLIISQPYFWASALFFVMAFMPVGFLIGLFYRRVDAYVGYATELVSGVVGFLLALIALVYVREENALFVASVVTACVAVKYAWGTGRKGVVLVALCVAGVSLGMLHANVQYGRFDLVAVAQCNPAYDTAISKMACLKELGYAYAPVRSAGSAVARIDIVALLTTGGPMLVTSFAGTQTDAIQSFPPEAYALDARIPDVVEVSNALIIGAGAEGVVKAVKADGASRIVALDLNGTVVDLWNDDIELNTYAQYPFRDVDLVAIDGRTYLATHDERFDVVTMMNTHRARGAGALGEPDFMHTREAFSLIYDHLTDDGMLVLEERRADAGTDTAIVRILTTIREALQEKGVSNPEQHLAVYSWGSTLPNAELVVEGERYVQIVVKREAFTLDDRARINQWSMHARRTDTRVMPANAIFGSWLWNGSNLTDAVARDEYATIVHTAEGTHERMLAGITDDRPFTLARDDAYVPIVFGAAGVGLIAIVASLLWWFWKTRQRTLRMRVLLPCYFFLIGMGYMFIETLFIAYLQLYTGSVLLSLIFSLAGLLVASAVGGMVMSTGKVSPQRWMYIAPVALAIALWCTLHVLPTVVFASVVLRYALALGVVIATGFALGAFFPLGITRASVEFRDVLPMLVGINGIALAVGVPLGFILALSYGFTATAVACVLLYIAAIAVYRWAQ